MKHIKYFDAMMESLQAINVLDKGISFTEESFTEVYEQAKEAINLHDVYINGSLEAFKDVYNHGVRKATVKGTVIGVVGTGIGIGAIKIGKKISKKRKLEKVEEEEV